MPFKDQFGFRGYYPDLEPQDVPDGGLLINSKNFRVEDRILKGKIGYEKLQVAALLGVPLRFYKYRKLDGTEYLIAATTTDVYRFDDSAGTFKFLTENYATGTVVNTSTVAEITEVTCPADVATSLNGTYWLLNSAKDATEYYVWYDVDSAPDDPAIAGKTGIEVDISEDDTATAVATATAAAINGEGDFGASSAAAVVTVTNAANGTTTDATDGDTGVTVDVTTQGTTNRTVTLSTGTWDVTWDDYTNPCYIGFADDDIDAITTWYEVASISSTTVLLLVADGPDASGADFVLRRTYNATAEYRWNCETFYDAGEDLNLLILTNGVDYPMKWDGDAGTPHFCEVLGGTPPKAKYVAQLGGRLIFGNIITVQASMTGTDLVYTIIWGPVADAESWEGGATDDAGYQELYGTMGDIKILAPFGYYLCIAKSDAIILLNSTGVAATPFNPTYITTKRGVAFDIYGTVNEFLGLMTEDDIVLFDGTANLRSIAKDKIRKTLFWGLNPAKRYGVTSVYAPRFDEWRIYVNNVDESYPSCTWIYKIKDNEWFYDDVGFTAAGSLGYVAGITIDGLDAVYATIDDIDVAIDDLAPTKRLEDIVASTEAGVIYVEHPSLKTLDGNDISVVAITKDFIGSDLELKDRYSEIWVIYKGTGTADDAIKIAISVDGGISYTSFYTITGTTGSARVQKQTSWNKSGRACRIMLDGRYMEVYGFKLLFTPEGLR